MKNVLIGIVIFLGLLGSVFAQDKTSSTGNTGQKNSGSGLQVNPFSVIGGIARMSKNQKVAYGGSAVENTGMATALWPHCGTGLGFFNCLAAAAATAQAGSDVVGVFSANKNCKAVGGCGRTNPYRPAGDPTQPRSPTDPYDPNYPDEDPVGSTEKEDPNDPYDPVKLQRKVNALKEQFKRKGIEIRPDGSVVTPKGIATPAMLGSGKSLADAGLLDAAGAAEYDKIMTEHQNKMKVINGAAIATGGGGGGYGGKRGVASYGEAPAFDPSAYGEKETPKAAMTSGLSKTFGNDPVGIATDDLFQMVHRRYRALDDRQTFVEP